MKDIPRRCHVDRLTPAEKAIYDAGKAVEAAGADPRLTKATLHLNEALHHVADFVDGIQETERYPRKVRTPRIGLMVDYQRFGSPGGEHKSEASPAVIVGRHPDGDWQLFVMNPNGCYFNKTPYSEDPKPGHWSWPKEEA